MKIVFLLKMSHMWLNHSFFSLVLKHFGRNSMKTSLFIQKSDISERSSEILRKLTFLYKFEREKTQRKIWIWCKQLFLFKAVKWDNYEQKQFFSTKLSHIQLYYVFLLFWSIFGLIHCKLLFLVQKVTISKRNTEILRKFVFLNKLEKAPILRNIWICLITVFNQTSKRR